MQRRGWTGRGTSARAAEDETRHEVSRLGEGAGAPRFRVHSVKWTGRILAVVLVILVGSVASCAFLADSNDEAASPPVDQLSQPSQTPTPQATPSPSPTPVRTSTLTGLPEVSASPVLIVKLDNTRNAQPHAGLRDADMVYIEEVEYGITRIAAVFSSKVPNRIGPVRSARITDVELLAQFGSPAFAFSGAQSKLWPVLAESDFIDISPNKGDRGYERDYDRRAPYNYFLDGQVGLERAPDASLSKDIGLVFSADPPDGGEPVTKARMEWAYASAAFGYQESSGTYRVHLNGIKARAEEDGESQRASNVIIQYVDQRPSIYFDKGGGNTPQAITVGTGKALVMRDGRAWEVTWNRPDEASGTTFTLPDGSPMTFKPGQTWIVLLDRDRTPILTGPVTASPSGSMSTTGTSDSSESINSMAGQIPLLTTAEPG